MPTAPDAIASRAGDLAARTGSGRQRPRRRDRRAPARRAGCDQRHSRPCRVHGRSARSGREAAGGPPDRFRGTDRRDRARRRGDDHRPAFSPVRSGAVRSKHRPGDRGGRDGARPVEATHDLRGGARRADDGPPRSGGHGSSCRASAGSATIRTITRRTTISWPAPTCSSTWSGAWRKRSDSFGRSSGLTDRPVSKKASRLCHRGGGDQKRDLRLDTREPGRQPVCLRPGFDMVASRPTKTRKLLHALRRRPSDRFRA
jgi:hypothetical protein